MALYLGSNKVGVAYNGGGGGESSQLIEKDVNFYDYDGTLLYSYTAEEFNEMAAMPENPSHEGLTSQGWNWSLADAKTQVTAMGKCDIGQMYVTTDGKTHIDIKLQEGRTSPYLGLAVNGSADVDWGDGTPHSTVTGSSLTTQIRTLHEYSAPGEYTIKIGVNSGDYNLIGHSTYTLLSKNSIANQNKVYASAVQRVRLSGQTRILAYTFDHCSSLLYVTVPSSATTISANAFSHCYALRHVSIPSGATSIPDSTFSNCYSLSSISIPYSVKSTSANAFFSCESIHHVTFPSGMTSVGGSTFQYCYSLQYITLPSGITSIGSNAFFGSYSISHITMPSSLTGISNGTFQNCYALESITVPSNVTSIGTNVFNACQGLGYIKFKPSSPPAVANSNAFNNIPTDCVISVPTGKLNDYKTASNYPDPNTYTYVEE